MGYLSFVHSLQVFDINDLVYFFVLSAHFLQCFFFLINWYMFKAHFNNSLDHLVELADLAVVLSFHVSFFEAQKQCQLLLSEFLPLDARFFEAFHLLLNLCDAFICTLWSQVEWNFWLALEADALLISESIANRIQLLAGMPYHLERHLSLLLGDSHPSFDLRVWFLIDNLARRLHYFRGDCACPWSLGWHYRGLHDKIVRLAPIWFSLPFYSCQLLSIHGVRSFDLFLCWILHFDSRWLLLWNDGLDDRLGKDALLCAWA